MLQHFSYTYNLPLGPQQGWHGKNPLYKPSFSHYVTPVLDFPTAQPIFTCLKSTMETPE